MGQTFRVANYLEFYFSHSNTVFSENATQRFYFQMLRQSFVKNLSEEPVLPVIAEGEPVMSYPTIS